MVALLRSDIIKKNRSIIGVSVELLQYLYNISDVSWCFYCEVISSKGIVVSLVYKCGAPAIPVIALAVLLSVVGKMSEELV